MLKAVRKAARERRGEPTLLCRAIYDFVAEGPEELSLRAGDEVQCHQKQDDGWWFGVVVDGERPRGGLFPGAYVEELPEDAPRPVVLREPLAESLVEGRTTELAPSPGKEALFAAAAGQGGEDAVFVEEAPEGDFVEDSPDDEEDSPDDEEDMALRTVLLLERRAEAAEASLAEERQKAAEFRDATTQSLRELNDALAQALQPVGGVLLTPPSETFWEDDAEAADDVENDLKRALTATLRTGPLRRKTLDWSDLCAAVSQVVARHATPMHTRQGNEFEATDWASPSVLNDDQRHTEVPLETPLKQTKIVDLRKPAPPPRSNDVAAEQKPQLRALFDAYKEGTGVGHVTPAGFLRLCRDKRLCPGLLDRRDCARLCKLELTKDCGLNEARLGRALARAAVAAFPAVDPACAVDELFDRVASVPTGLPSSPTGAPADAPPPQMLPLSPLQVHGYPAYYHQPGAAPAPARGGDPNNT